MWFSLPFYTTRYVQIKLYDQLVISFLNQILARFGDKRGDKSTIIGSILSEKIRKIQLCKDAKNCNLDQKLFHPFKSFRRNKNCTEKACAV